MSEERSATDVDKKIGELIRAHRLEKGKSQERLAEDLGLTFQQVQKYEKGVNRVAASRLLDIADALEVDVNELLPPRKSTPSASRVSAMLATPEGIRLIGVFAKVGQPKIRRRLLDLVIAVAAAEAKEGCDGEFEEAHSG